MSIRKSTWTTFRTSCYTHDVANHPASTGGIHDHEVRRIRGRWQVRIRQANGPHVAHGPARFVSDAEGEARWAEAQSFRASLHA